MGTLVVSDSAGIDTAGSCRPAGNPAALANYMKVPGVEAGQACRRPPQPPGGARVSLGILPICVVDRPDATLASSSRSQVQESSSSANPPPTGSYCSPTSVRVSARPRRSSLSWSLALAAETMIGGPNGCQLGTRREPGPRTDAVGVTEVGIESHGRSVCQQALAVSSGPMADGFDPLMLTRQLGPRWARGSRPWLVRPYLRLRALMLFPGHRLTQQASFSWLAKCRCGAGPISPSHAYATTSPKPGRVLSRSAARRQRAAPAAIRLGAGRPGAPQARP